jgi:CRP-like cAMP-binding protein/membrane protein YdbS with pleckstrin-like domain
MNLQQKANFLKQLKIFAELTDEELSDLARLVTTYRFQQGAIISYQRDVADKMYIIQEGRLEEFIVNEAGTVTAKRVYQQHQYFEDAWLFTPGLHPGTIRATSNGTLFTISGSDFADWMGRHSDAVIDMSEAAWQAADLSGATLKTRRRYRKFELLADETVIHESRRSRWVLLYQTAIPLIILFGFFGLIYYLFYRTLGWPTWIESILSFLLVIGPLFWVIYSFLDWYNDWLLITNKFVIHREFELRHFSGAVFKLPISRVQSVNALTPGFIQTLFRIGNIRITTAAQEVAVEFKNVSDPQNVQNSLRAVIEAVRQTDRDLGQARTQEEIRRAVESHYNLDPQLESIADEIDPEDEVAAVLRPPSWLRRSFGYRVEEDGVITFRRHWIVFVQRAVWYIGALILWIIVVTSFGILAPGSLTTNPLVVLTMLVLLFFILFALYWYYVDWRNDIYQVTENSIIDLARLPLGFGASRTEAPLSNVQNVNVAQPNLWATLLRYGDVTVDTAGASANIVFRTVVRPNRVQTDIFRRLERSRQLHGVRQGEDRRRDFITMMDVFRQVDEQQDLPRRTPIRDEHVDEDIDWYEN